MIEQTWGKITARGNPAEVALVRRALDECVNSPIPFENAPAIPYTIEFHSRKEFRDRGYILPGNITAEGRVVSKGLLWVRSDLRPRRAKHLVRHEISHVLPLTPAKRQELMTHMYREDGSHPTNWRAGRYETKPYECFADSMAEAVSGIDSPFDDFRYYQVDVKDDELPLFVEIVFRPGPVVPPVIDEEPDMLPAVDPRFAELEAQVAQLGDNVMHLNARLAAKDAKLKEALDA